VSGRGIVRPLVGFALLLLSAAAVGRLVGGGVLSVVLPALLVIVALVVSVVRTVREDDHRNAVFAAASPMERPAAPSRSASHGRIDA
jgi:hypothetical protein